MKIIYTVFVSLTLAICANAQDTTTNSYTQTNLISDLSTMAPVTDAHLKNPWGLSRTASSYWWVSDNDTGVSTLYGGTGFVDPLVVTIPTASGTGTGSPTGTVAVGSKFVFVTLDGTISEWSSGTSAVIRVNRSASHAVYTGVTLATNGTVATLYVANSNGGVETYNAATFARITLAAGAFTDKGIPAGYTPYGIQRIGTSIYVTYSNGVGGYVDAFDTAGTLLLRLQHGRFTQPWGVAQAPASWGPFGHALLVGNVGSGWIGVYNPTTGAFINFLKDSSGQDIAIPGLWAIFFGGGGAFNGPTTSLYFAAGVNGYADGLFGTITPN